MTRIEFIRDKPIGIGFIEDIHISIEFTRAYNRYWVRYEINLLVLDLLEIYILISNLLMHMIGIKFVRDKPIGIGFIGDIHISIEFINAYDRYWVH